MASKILIYVLGKIYRKGRILNMYLENNILFIFGIPIWIFFKDNYKYYKN